MILICYRCNRCSVVFDANSSGNFIKHIGTDNHKSKMMASGKVAVNTCLADYMTRSDGPDRDILKEVRILWHGMVVAEGLNPNVMEEIFKSQSMIIKTFNLLKNNVTAIATKSTITTDCAQAVVYMDEKIKTLINKNYVSLIVDGASLKSDKVIAINLTCPKFEKPLLLTLLTPDDKFSSMDDPDSTVYDFKKAASDIRSVCNKWDLNIEDQVYLMCKFYVL